VTVAERSADPPALARLVELDRLIDRRITPRSGADTGVGTGATADTMGYRPGLDGLRAISVVAVIVYHAGVVFADGDSWLPGGFFGVEVFFVVSGYLITSLLLEEQGASGGVSLRNFWMRRARRLFPALAAMLVAVASWAAFWGSAEQTSQLRRDLPWSILYAGNWGQILGDVPYYSGDPPLLRHVWSLAVEEQWYLVWPLAFVALMGLSRARRARIVAGLGVAAMVLTAWLSFGGAQLRSPIGLIDGVDRVNFMYLSTPTRASGLLLGAAAAFVWRPWRRRQEVSAESARRLDVVAALGIVVLVAAFAFAHLPESYVYRWLLPLVTVASLALTAIVVVPASTRIGRVMSWRPLVEIGRRSYGLYLWHWPVFVIAGGTGSADASAARVTIAVVATVIVSELCYRFVETPVRKGALGRWWRDADRQRLLALGACAFLVVALGAFYRNVQTFDAAQGGRETQFSLPAATPSALTGDIATTVETPSTEDAPSTGAPPTDATSPVTNVAAPPELPIDLGIVGDSQAHALAVNLPSGIESTFAVNDGSLDGCSIYESGNVVSSRDFRNDFGMCANWRQAWAEAAAGNDVVLVVLGAWDVFDLEIDGQTLTFASPEWDAAFTSRLQSGIDAIDESGTTAALLEVPCMRPIDIDGAGVPAVPERGDDARVAHVNDLMRQLAAEQPDRAGFVGGPTQWCNGSSEATDTAYRWDGVHVYVPGANLIFETIAPSLLALA